MALEMFFGVLFSFCKIVSKLAEVCCTLIVCGLICAGILYDCFPGPDNSEHTLSQAEPSSPAKKLRTHCRKPSKSLGNRKFRHRHRELEMHKRSIRLKIQESSLGRAGKKLFDLTEMHTVRRLILAVPEENLDRRQAQLEAREEKVRASELEAERRTTDDCRAFWAGAHMMAGTPAGPVLADDDGLADDDFDAFDSGFDD